MAEHKPTTDPKQIWTFLGLATLACAIFGYAVLPLMDPGRGKLGGQIAPDFTLRVLSEGEQGNRLALSDQQGQVVILDFWASWCLPCREQAPILERFANAHKDDKVTVIGVNTGDVEPAALDFIRTVGVTYPTVFDEQGMVARAFHAEELPTLVVIDPQGKVIATAARVVREGQLEEWVREASGVK
jgi:cytochrome c biogenesis protein CcmG, thiol:disulfide interchange protein DsbE